MVCRDEVVVPVADPDGVAVVVVPTVWAVVPVVFPTVAAAVAVPAVFRVSAAARVAVPTVVAAAAAVSVVSMVLTVCRHSCCTMGISGILPSRQEDYCFD